MAVSWLLFHQALTHKHKPEFGSFISRFSLSFSLSLLSDSLMYTHFTYTLFPRPNR